MYGGWLHPVLKLLWHMRYWVAAICSFFPDLQAACQGRPSGWDRASRGYQVFLHEYRGHRKCKVWISYRTLEKVTYLFLKTKVLWYPLRSGTLPASRSSYQFFSSACISMERSRSCSKSAAAFCCANASSYNLCDECYWFTLMFYADLISILK